MLQGLFAHRLTYCPWTNSRCTWRDREAGVDCGRPLACRRLAGPGVVGAPGSSRLLPIPAAPSGGNPLATATITSHAQCAEGPQGSGRDSGLDAGGANPHNPRLPVPGATTNPSKSYRKFSPVMRTHVEPQWGSWPLARIDHSSVQTWVTELGQRRSPELVAKCYQLTAAVLKSAVRDRLIAVNPCDGVRLPRRRKQDHQGRVISQDELLTKLLPAAPERYRALIATAAGTGLRWGEVAGLCLDAVDLAAGRLYVIRTVVEVSGHTAFKPYPKSAAGRRTIPLPRWLTEIIANHLASYALGVDQLVFPNTVGAPLRRTLFRSRVWKPTLQRAGLDPTLRFHDLRHSYATWLVDDGVPVNVVQRVMGHERSSTTLDLYTRRSDGEGRILHRFGKRRMRVADHADVLG